MAKIENGCLIIIEGDKYIVKGDTLVFLGQEGEENADRRVNSERKEGN